LRGEKTATQSHGLRLRIRSIPGRIFKASLTRPALSISYGKLRNFPVSLRNNGPSVHGPHKHLRSIAPLATTFGRRWSAELPPGLARSGRLHRSVLAMPSSAWRWRRYPWAGSRPADAFSYFTDAGLRKLMRDPAAVRTWPQQQMPPADAITLPDADNDAVIAYLRLISGTAPR
jgi:hypothetical protein